MRTITITRGALTLDDLRTIHREPVRLALSDECRSDIERAAATVDRVIHERRTVYGINTGFGLLAGTRIPPDELEELQHSIVLSHAAGVGPFLEPDSVRLVMALKVNSLARGYSGVRPVVVDRLIELVNREIYPAIPAKGSVGASGDLAPLAHMSAVLLGEGEVLVDGRSTPAGQVLSAAGIDPIVLAPKEGLALLNGTQVSTALALEGLFAGDTALRSAVVLGAMAVDAARGSRVPFDPRIHAARGHTAQIDVAAAYRKILAHSQIEESHRACGRVQDPYSLRCQPQVLGACLQQLRHAREMLLIEANGVSDNPLVFTDTNDILSGGNFHAEPVAMAADGMALALAEIGSLAERQIALLIDTNLSGLPPFLVEKGGLNSGFMIAQVTAAALASENKSRAHPASVDSLPTSANQEDHVSMATFAARRLADMYDNVVGILAVLWLAAAQGLDFLAPLESSGPLEEAKRRLRERVPFYDADRYFAPDIAAASELLRTEAAAELSPELL